ncbi:MAG: branched-chain amino acid ABC transporter permease [Candidatus Eremiobacteraeota bacterium]|nr:branched-chain amino acid ABC transporter permease [Candidatus Eremiobacteraeota bacterium]
MLVATIMLLLGILLPWVVYPVFAFDLIAFGLFAVSLDLLFGFAGLLSFGHALFWGGAGYASTLVIKLYHLPFLAAVGAGVLYALVLAAVVGFVAIRRQGIYFAMITLAIAQIQYFFAFELVWLTGGENGVQTTSRGWFFGYPIENDVAFYYLTLAIVVLGVWFAVRVVRSPFGSVLTAMRENERRAISLGYATARFKLVTFVMSGTLAGLAGALFAIGNRLSGLDGVAWQTSGKVVMMTVLGGIGTIFGPIVGAGIFESLEYFVSKTAIGDKTNIVLGTVFAVVILLARRGVVGEILAATIRREPLREQAEPVIAAEEPVSSRA